MYLLKKFYCDQGPTLIITYLGVFKCLLNGFS